MKTQVEYGIMVLTAKTSKDRDYLTALNKALNQNYPYNVTPVVNVAGKVIEMRIPVVVGVE